jgi:hypothetical protein
VYYQMFNAHEKVRRAATECLCNMATAADVLALMKTDKLKLWLGLSEEHDVPEEENPEVCCSLRYSAC